MEGCASLPYIFYRMFQRQLAVGVTAAFREALENGRLGDGLYRSRLVLLPNGGDPTRLENWWPITLTNIDDLVLACVLQWQLGAVMGKLLVGVRLRRCWAVTSPTLWRR